MTKSPNIRTSKKIDDSVALTSEQTRVRLYEIASKAHLGKVALEALEPDDETTIALERLIREIKDQLLHIAGGPTFDRLTSLEAGAVR